MFNKSHPANLSLLISDLTEQDQGTYRCSINNQQSISIRLSITGCALVENKQTGTVSRSSGESVLLSCTCTDPQDTPVTVQWRGPNQEDLLQRSRVQTFTRTSPGNHSVLISDLTVEDAGTYSCWINQNQYRTFTLTVKGGGTGRCPQVAGLVDVLQVAGLVDVLRQWDW
ncbi:hypothetical protein NFI96_008868 [Prochilodus magdalenae]|nr:hypothetical protein NFI96_008868 [Prochilodus magdalenae]